MRWAMWAKILGRLTVAAVLLGVGYAAGNLYPVPPELLREWFPTAAVKPQLKPDDRAPPPPRDGAVQLVARVGDSLRELAERRYGLETAAKEATITHNLLRARDGESEACRRLRGRRERIERELRDVTGLVESTEELLMRLRQEADRSQHPAASVAPDPAALREARGFLERAAALRGGSPSLIDLERCAGDAKPRAGSVPPSRHD